jgi:hypothetical protein
MLWHFPLDHPVVATALTMLGQVNAQELNKIAATKGTTPSILDYMMPVVQKRRRQGSDSSPCRAAVLPRPLYGAASGAHG